MKKLAIILILAVTAASASMARTAKEEIDEHIELAGNQYYAYPTPDTTHYTKAPKGYKPFYISTYQRHGSRFLLGKKDYTKPQEVLHKADSLGTLTETGRLVMQVVDTLECIARDRYGELTPLGFRQHADVARRMYHNFPEVFKGHKRIDARSTNVIRCVLSMMSECYTLKGCNPQLEIHTDASVADLYYMNNGASSKPNPLHKLESGKEFKEALEKAKTELIKPDRIIGELFTEYDENVMPLAKRRFYSMLYELAISMQNLDFHEELLPLFTLDECYNSWLYSNYFWYNNCGFSPVTKYAKPYAHEALLRNIMDTADTIITRGGDAATLRFGHDGILLPLAALMHIDNCAYVAKNMDDLAEHWRSYTMFPMACNIQIIFFKTKKASDPVLVKIMLNEKESKLPIDAINGVYYEWDKVKAYWTDTVLAAKPKFE